MPNQSDLTVILQNAQRLVIIQADNPDADSLGSALALESILGDMGKEPLMYCGVDMPGYLRYLAGWDRVQKELPRQFDASIIVDASTVTLLERLQDTGEFAWLATKPCIVLDHHAAVEQVIPFASVLINRHELSSTGELIYTLAREYNWPLSVPAQEFLLAAILGDTQGLSNQMAAPATYRVVADMIEGGVDRIRLEEARREFGKMPAEIFRYKAQLISRTEFSNDGRVASVLVPQPEINQFSPLYNPAPLIQNDMLQTSGVAIAIVFKTYDDGRMTGAIRCNHGYPIGANLATAMGGGGHAYASGFKDTSGRPFNEIKSECLAKAADLLQQLESGKEDETIQHAFEAN